MFDVDANLFRLAYLATSTEETRYYLMGVYLEPLPHDGGALLVATNGHVALVLRDPTGVVETPVIVRATKPTLTACRPRNVEQRRLRGDMAENPIRVDLSFGKDKPAHNLALQSDWRVDGTFPDWRRVLPVIPADSALVTDCYKAGNLAIFGEVARGLGGSDGITVASVKIGDPALVRWHGGPGVDLGFGVVMPTRMSPELVRSYPEWIR